jgi:hypothetical protein
MSPARVGGDLVISRCHPRNGGAWRMVAKSSGDSRCAVGRRVQGTFTKRPQLAVQRGCPNGDSEAALAWGGGRPLATGAGQASHGRRRCNPARLSKRRVGSVRAGCRSRRRRAGSRAGRRPHLLSGDLAWVLAGGRTWWSAGVRGGRGEQLLSLSGISLKRTVNPTSLDES